MVDHEYPEAGLPRGGDSEYWARPLGKCPRDGHGGGGGGVWHVPDGGRTDPKNQNFKIVLETFLEKNFRLKTIFYWFLAQFQSGVDSHIFPLGILKEFHVHIHKIENHQENVKKNRFDTILGPRM